MGDLRSASPGRILVVANMYPSRQDPTYGTFVKIFAESLGRLVPDLAVIRGRSRKWRSLLAYVRFYAALVGKFLFTRHDLVYVHYILHPAIALLPLSWLRPGSVIVLHVHGDDILPKSAAHRFLFAFAKRLAHRADGIVVPSEYYRGIASEALDVPKEKILVWGSSGVDLDVFKPGPEREPDPRGMSIACVSRLETAKGMHVLLRGAREFLDRGGRLRAVHLAGYGSEDERARLLQDIADLGLGDVVTYHGALPHHELQPLLAGCDLFVFPTYRKDESLGLVGVEAMACGLPVVGTDICAIPDFVHHGLTGFLFPPRDHAALASCLQEWSALSAQERSEMRGRCLDMAGAYARTKLAKEMDLYLDSLLAAKGRR